MRCGDGARQSLRARSAARTSVRWVALLAACAGVAGCASVGSLFEQVPLGGPRVDAPVVNAPDAGAPAASRPRASVPEASAPAAAPTSAAAAAATPSPAVRAASAAAAASTAAKLPLVYGAEPEVPVSAATQQAYDEARRLMRAGNVAEAERGFRALAQAHPDLGGPHANLGVLYRQAGKLAEAVAEGEKAVRANPKQPLYFNQLGISYRHSGQFAKAREAYETAIELAPTYASPLLNLGILHDLYLGDGQRALALYDKYLALLPGGDAVVSKWVADLKNRKPQPVAVNQKEKE